MAVIEKKYTINVKSVGSGNSLTNSGFLSLFEEVACFHSDMAGYGLNQIEKTHLTWILLHWKVKVLKRPEYNETVIVRTWARDSSNYVTYRDFEMLNENGDCLCIASSKWTLVNTETRKLAKITPEIIGCYAPECKKNIFGVIDIDKLKEPINNNLQPNYIFTVLRRDIDINNHMHNLYYLDYALEALPQDVFENSNINQFEIMYKNGAKLGDVVNCYYLKQEDGHYVVMKSADNTKLHAIVKLYY